MDITIHPRTPFSDVLVMAERYGLDLIDKNRVLSFKTTPQTHQPQTNVIAVKFPEPPAAA